MIKTTIKEKNERTPQKFVGSLSLLLRNVSIPIKFCEEKNLGKVEVLFPSWIIRQIISRGHQISKEDRWAHNFLFWATKNKKNEVKNLDSAGTITIFPASFSPCSMYLSFSSFDNVLGSRPWLWTRNNDIFWLLNIRKMRKEMNSLREWMKSKLIPSLIEKWAHSFRSRFHPRKYSFLVLVWKEDDCFEHYETSQRSFRTMSRYSVANGNHIFAYVAQLASLLFLLT